MLPAGVIRSVDHDDERIFVNRTKDEIKNAPEFDDSFLMDDDYRGGWGRTRARGFGLPRLGQP